MVKPEKETTQSSTESEAPKVEPEAEVTMEAKSEEAAAGSEAPAKAIPKHEIEAVIRKRVYATMAVGLAPIPLLDLAGISAIQVEMIRALANKYGVPFRADAVKTIISSLVGGVMPVAFAPVVASLMKFIPIIGWTASGVSLSLIAGATTYALGNVFARHFESGGVLLDFDVNKVRSVFKSKLDEGKTVVSKLKQEQQPNS
jgi:uncharacterized protein (DUF697 family)